MQGVSDFRKSCQHGWWEEHWDRIGDETLHCVGGSTPDAQELMAALLAIRYIGHYLPLDKIPNGRMADELRSRGYKIDSTYLDALGCLPWEPGDMPAEVAIRRGREEG